jgi:hypothetical protein
MGMKVMWECGGSVGNLVALLGTGGSVGFVVRMWWLSGIRLLNGDRVAQWDMVAQCGDMADQWGMVAQPEMWGLSGDVARDTRPSVQ